MSESAESQKEFRDEILSLEEAGNELDRLAYKDWLRDDNTVSNSKSWKRMTIEELRGSTPIGEYDVCSLVGAMLKGALVGVNDGDEHEKYQEYEWLCNEGRALALELGMSDQTYKDTIIASIPYEVRTKWPNI